MAWRLGAALTPALRATPLPVRGRRGRTVSPLSRKGRGAGVRVVHSVLIPQLSDDAPRDDLPVDAVEESPHFTQQ
jgi:hypothetical protein